MNHSDNNRQFFPMFVDLSEDHILVVGGGTVALRKTRTLAKFCRHITVTAPVIRPEFAKLESEGAVVCNRRSYCENDLDGVRIAVVATNDAGLNREIAEQCSRRGILKNVASDRTLCDFYFPSVIEQDGIVIGIGSGGDPARTKQMRELLEEALQITAAPLPHKDKDPAAKTEEW